MILRAAIAIFVLCLIAAAIAMSRNQPRIVKERGSEHEAHGDVPWIVTQARYPSPQRLRDVEPMGM